MPTLGLAGGILTVMGHNNETLGFMLFKTVADLTTFTKLAEANTFDQELLPHCFSLTCELQGIAADLGEGVLPLPEATVFDKMGQRAPSKSELRMLIGSAIGLAKFFKRWGDTAALNAAWNGGKPVKGRYKVKVLDQEHFVSIRAPASH